MYAFINICIIYVYIYRERSCSRTQACTLSHVYISIFVFIDTCFTYVYMSVCPHQIHIHRYLDMYPWIFGCICIDVWKYVHACLGISSYTFGYVYTHTCDMHRCICMWDLIHMWDMTHSYVGQDSIICGAWLIHMWHASIYMYLGPDSFMCGRDACTNMNTWNEAVSWIHSRDMTHSYVWHDAFICWTWLIHMWDIIHSCLWGLTHSYVWRDSCMDMNIWKLCHR